jgi:hypothetical protein
LNSLPNSSSSSSSIGCKLVERRRMRYSYPPSTRRYLVIIIHAQQALLWRTCGWEIDERQRKSTKMLPFILLDNHDSRTSHHAPVLYLRLAHSSCFLLRVTLCRVDRYHLSAPQRRVCRHTSPTECAGQLIGIFRSPDSSGSHRG